MSNSLRQVTGTDRMYLKRNMEVFFDWYIRNCEEIIDLAQYFGEEEDDTVTSILSTGLSEIQNRVEMMKEGDMKRGDQL